MYEVLFIFVVVATAVYLCLRKRRRLLEAQLQVRMLEHTNDTYKCMQVVRSPLCTPNC